MIPQTIEVAKTLTNRWEAIANDLHRIIVEMPMGYPRPQYIDECGDASTVEGQWHGVNAHDLHAQLTETRAHIDSIVAAARRATQEAEERNHTPEEVEAATNAAVSAQREAADRDEELKREARQIPLAELVLVYTGHGHPYPASARVTSQQRPTAVARCGGPALCQDCAIEAGWGAMAPGNYVSPNAHELAALHAHDVDW